MAETIERLSVRAVNVPLRRPIRTAIGALPSAPLVLVDLVTSDGVAGRTYLNVYKAGLLKALVATVEAAGAEVAGRSAAPHEVACHLDQSFRLLGRQGLVGLAIAGIETAAWDAAARRQKLSLARLLGGSERPIPAYDSFGIIDPAADRAAIEASLRQGFRAIKIKIGGGSLAEDVARVGAVRAIIGANVTLMVDYNQSLSQAEACRRIELLLPFDLLWVEEPVAAEDFAGHALVRSRSGARIQTGENWMSVGTMQRAITAGACDFAMPDLQRIGGVSGWLKAAALAESVGMPMSSHVFVEASAHLMAVTPTAHWLEYLDVASPILLEPATVAPDGTVSAQGDGIGVEWNEAAVSRYAA